MVLYINACVRSDSRTDRLARAYLKKYASFEEIKLADIDPKPLNAEALAKRTALIAAGNTVDESFALARQFAEAEEIVIAAPFWDAGFPALLKAYLENIYIIGIVTKYDDKGMPVGLCKAKKLCYITTAGGKFFADFSYDYIRALVTMCFGIEKTELIYAENLDIVGSDADKIIEERISTLNI